MCALVLGVPVGHGQQNRRIKMIIDRVKNILLTPKQEWPVIEPEPTTPAQLYTGYVIPLAALSAVLTLIHMSVIGMSVPYLGTMRLPFVSSLQSAVVTFAFSLLGLYIVALIINGLAPNFGGVRDQRQALKTAAYAFTPAWLAAVFGLLPVLSTLLSLLAGLYGIYLLYLGLPVVMKAPVEKAVGYTVTVVICTILVGIVLGALMAALHLGGMGGLGGAYGNSAFHGMGGQTEEARQARAAAMAGALVGNVLGTDEKGKEGLAKAMAQMAAAGRQIEQEQKAANAGSPDAAAPATQSVSGADAATAASAVTATARLASAVGGALGGDRRVDPVDFRALKAMLPESVAGMQRTGAAGSNQQALGVKTSNATGDYQGAGDARLHIKIADISGVSGLLGVAGALGQKTDSESDSGFEKDTTIGGRQFHEKFQNAGKHGEVTTIVAQRFEVDVTGDGTDIAALEQAAGSIDFAHLEGMKDQGAQSH
jgi:Yip1 domain